MHAAEREKLILRLLGQSGFISYRDLEAALDASPATIRRDLSKLEDQGKIVRVHGGAKSVSESDEGNASSLALKGTPFTKSVELNRSAKHAIGQAAAALCERGEGVMIDGGSTTFQMCEHLEGLELQVLTNSLHIVNALLSQEGTQILVPSGTIFREQNIILAPAGEASMPRFHAPKLFMGAAAVGPHGVMQADAILVAAERRLIERAERVILLADHSKFATTSGKIVCPLESLDVLVTDKMPGENMARALNDAGVEVIIAG